MAQKIQGITTNVEKMPPAKKPRTASSDGKGVSDATAAALRDLQGESGVSGAAGRPARPLMGVRLRWSAALPLSP